MASPFISFYKMHRLIVALFLLIPAVGCVSHNCRDCKSVTHRASLLDSLGVITDTLRAPKFYFAITQIPRNSNGSSLSENSDCECNAFINTLSVNRPILIGVDTIPAGVNLNDSIIKSKISDSPKGYPAGSFDNSLVIFKSGVKLKRGINIFHLFGGSQNGEFRDSVSLFVPETLGF